MTGKIEVTQVARNTFLKRHSSHSLSRRTFLKHTGVFTIKTALEGDTGCDLNVSRGRLAPNFYTVHPC